MSQSGISDDLIVQAIRKSHKTFDLSADQLIRLKTSAGISDRVLAAMLDPSSVDSVRTTSASTAPRSSLPTEIGVYVKHRGVWSEVLPEVVNWKTGGVIKSAVTLLTIKEDINGHIRREHSSTEVANSVVTPIEFLIVTPDGVAVTEYQLLQLREHSSSREFRTITGGIWHASSGATRDLLDFDGKKVAPHTYAVTFASRLEAGEYGFLPTGAIASTNAAGSTGKIYSFRVIE